MLAYSVLLIGIALNEGDALAWTRLTSGHDMLIVATRNGQAIRFNEEDARPMGRSGHGVRAIRLAEGDEVVGVCICREGGTVLTVTENGKGRRSDIDTYRITARGGKGIRNYDVSRDKVAAVKIVDDVDGMMPRGAVRRASSSVMTPTRSRCTPESSE